MTHHISEAECLACDWPIEIQTRHGDQTVICPDCGAHFWASYDAEAVGEIGMPATWRGGFTLTREDPPTEMDLRSDI